MLKKSKWGNSKATAFTPTGLILLALLLLTATAFGQTTGDAQTTAAATTAAQTPSPPLPVWKSYKDVKIGTTANEVRERLGKKAAIDDEDGFFYQFDDETAQIRIDRDKKVRFIAVTYANGNENAPKYADVFGADAAFEPGADGKVYKLVRFPQAGYWVAYSRTAGDEPSVTVTMQKL